MRGKGPAGQILVVSVGITPACAGKSRSQPRLPCTGRDHPRACGEKSISICAVWLDLGSPPRVRGKDTGFPPGALCHGITPACAGKSCTCCCASIGGTDHPRVCEEKNFLLLMTSRRSGSPPRVRGKDRDEILKTKAYRITPAYAGKSPFPGCGR